MQYVSEHIDYAAAIRSDVAKRKGINNYFTPEQLGRMKTLAEKVYEPLIAHFGIVIYISSFFRNKEVNKLLGGATNSQHLANNGAAMDLDADNNPWSSANPSKRVNNRDVFNYIKDHLEFDQLIWEDGNDINPGWVHVSYNEGKNRKQILKMVRVDGKSTYVKY